jgi:hypothetical protein
MTRDEVIACLTFPGHSTQQQIALRNQCFHKLIVELDTPEQIEQMIASEYHRYCIEDFVPVKGSKLSPENALWIMQFYLVDSIQLFHNHDSVFVWFSKFNHKHLLLPGAGQISNKTPNMTRWENGELKELKELRRFLKNNQYIDFAAISAIKHEDVEGLNHILQIPKVSDYSESNLSRWLKEIKPVKNEFYEMLSGPVEIKFPIQGYINSISEYSCGGFTEKINQFYNKELSGKMGNEILFAIRDHHTQAAAHLAKMITEDGGDWYLGYKQITTGHAIYMDFKDLERNILEEVNEILDTFTVRSAKNCAGYIQGIVKGIPIELAIEIAKSSQESAEKFMILREDEKFLPYVSSQKKRSFLESNLDM